MMNSILIFFHLVLVFVKVATSVKNVTLTLNPDVVKRYHSCTLMCTYDLEDMPLYTVKFFRGFNEFYRYTPRELPNTKTFSFHGINVDLSNSNSTQVVLTDIDFQLSGNFSCEVTVDFKFYTSSDTKTMIVVELPAQPPTISIAPGVLDIGVTLHANCSSPPSRPPATLKFLLNNIMVGHSETIDPLKYKESEWSDLQLILPLSEYHFSRGKLVLICVAKILNVYKEVAELRLDSARDPVPERVRALNASAPMTTLHPSLLCLLILFTTSTLLVVTKPF